MKNFRKVVFLLMAAVLALPAAGCTKQDAYVLSTKNVINASYGGAGFEWDLYETAPAITKAQWDKTLERVDFIKPGVVRVMFDLGRFLKGFLHNSDKTFSPIYQWENAYMNNLYDILDYCEKSGVKVYTGMWQASRAFTYKENGATKYIIEDEGSRYFYETVCDMLEYLLNVKGYTCIKGLIPYNEPNYIANRGDRWDTYLRCVNGFFYEFTERGLIDKIDILGPDTSGLTETPSWFNDCVTYLDEKIDAYEMHAYVNDYTINNRNFEQRLKNLKYDNLNKTDKKFYIFEAGLQDGRNSTNRGHDRIDTFEYANILTDYFVQTLYGGVDGVAFWSLDSAMHLNGKGEYIEFSMFNSQDDNIALRPFYHAAALISRLMSDGSTIYGKENKDIAMRVAGSVSKDKKTAGMLIYNQSAEERIETFGLDVPFETAKKTYVYVMSEAELCFDKNGYATPSYVIDGALNKSVRISVPAKTAVYLSNKVF